MPTTLPRLRSIFPFGARTGPSASGARTAVRRPGSIRTPMASPLAWLLLPFAVSPLVAAGLYVSRSTEVSARGPLVSALVPIAFVVSFALALGSAALASVDLVVTDEHVEVRFGPRTVTIALADVERCTVAPSPNARRGDSQRFGFVELVYLERSRPPSGGGREHSRVRRLLVRVGAPFVTSREITLAARRARAPEEAHPARVVVAAQSRPTLH